MPHAAYGPTGAEERRSRNLIESGNKLNGTLQMANGREGFPAVRSRSSQKLRLDDSDDLMRARIDDHNLIAHEDVVVPTPFRIDHNDLSRQRIDMHVGRNTRADAH